MTTTTDKKAAKVRKENPYADEYRHFVEQTKDHELTVLHHEGFYRHLRMGKPGQGSIWSWQISTIPWLLTTFGDVADGHSFSREEDMIEFFSYAGKSERYYSDDAPSIDFSYWAEKLRGERGSNGVKKYSSEIFLQMVREHLDDSETLGTEARTDRDEKIALIKIIHHMRGLSEEQSSALFAEYAEKQASPSLERLPLGGVYSLSWRQANNKLCHALNTLWDVDDLSDEQLNTLIEKHDYHRIADNDFPATDPLVKIEEIISDAKWSADDETSAHTWLRENEKYFGGDTWEWDLRDWDIHFLFTCWAINLTVEKWREHITAQEANPITKGDTV